MSCFPHKYLLFEHLSGRCLSATYRSWFMNLKELEEHETELILGNEHERNVIPSCSIKRLPTHLNQMADSRHPLFSSAEAQLQAVQWIQVCWSRDASKKLKETRRKTIILNQLIRISFWIIHPSIQNNKCKKRIKDQEVWIKLRLWFRWLH